MSTISSQTMRSMHCVMGWGRSGGFASRTALGFAGWLAVAAVAQAQDSAGQFEPRQATSEDARLLDGPFVGLKRETQRIGLRQEIGKTCSAFVTVDSIRPAETPLPLDDATVTLPYASFMIWSSDRPSGDAILYHIFSSAEDFYRQPQMLPPSAGKTNGQTYAIVLAPRQPYPDGAAVAAQRGSLSAGPFVRSAERGIPDRLAVKPYVFPTQADDPASVLPRKAQHDLDVTCLADRDRVKNCLCVGTS